MEYSDTYMLRYLDQFCRRTSAVSSGLEAYEIACVHECQEDTYLRPKLERVRAVREEYLASDHGIPPIMYYESASELRPRIGTVLLDSWGVALCDVFAGGEHFYREPHILNTDTMWQPTSLSCDAVGVLRVWSDFGRVRNGCGLSAADIARARAAEDILVYRTHNGARISPEQQEWRE